MNENNKGLILTHVVKRFDNNVVVDKVSFTLEKGKLLTLLGPSGCGKTTTLRMIAGLEQVSGGKIYLNGADITLAHPSKRNIGMVFQSYALFPHMSVYENVAYGLIEAKVAKEERRARIDEILKTVGLGGLEDRAPSQLSGGQQQRVALARSLVMKPSLLLFDEPLSNLDTVLRNDIRMEIRDLQQKFNLTSVYVTHDQEEAMAISDEVIVMKDGILQQQSSPKDFYRRPKTEFIAQFISNASILNVEVSRCDKAGVVIKNKDFSITLPYEGREDVKVGAVKIAVSPHNINIHPTNDASRLPAKIMRVIYLGSFTNYRVSTAYGMIEIMAKDEVPLKNNNTVYLSFDPQKVAVVG